jgi:hypothetical protein
MGCIQVDINPIYGGQKVDEGTDMAAFLKSG